MNNAVNYRILREDHTLGHLLRMCVPPRPRRPRRPRPCR